MNLKREKLSDSNSLQASDLSSIDDASIDKNNIYLESESDRSSQSSSSTKNKKQNQFSIEQLLEKRLSTFGEKIKSSSDMRKTRKNKSKRRHSRHTKTIEQERKDDSNFEVQDKSVPHSSNEDNIVVFPYFKLSLDETIVFCVFCDTQFSNTKSLSNELNRHIAQRHPSRFACSQKKLQSQKEPEDSSNYFYPKFCSPVGRKSLVWQNFLLNEKMKIAICKYCKFNYNVFDGCSTRMYKHIQQISKSIQEGKKKQPEQASQIKEEDYIFIKQKIKAYKERNKLIFNAEEKQGNFRVSPIQPIDPKSISTNNSFSKIQETNKPPKLESLFEILYKFCPITPKFLIANYIQSSQKISTNDALNFVRKQHWSNQQEYGKMFWKLRKYNFGIIKQNAIQGIACNVCIITQQMSFRYVQNRDCLCFWIQKPEVNDTNFSYFAYLTVQSKTGTSICVGFIIVFQHSLASCDLMLHSIFQQLKYEPSSFFVFGGLNESKTLKESAQKIIPKASFLSFPFLDNIYNERKFCLNQILNLNIKTFVGLVLTKKYIDSVKVLVSCSQLAKKTLGKFLYEFFWRIKILSPKEQVIETSTLDQKFLDQDQQPVYFQEYIYDIRSKVSEPIFLKFIFLYVYSRQNVRIYSQDFKSHEFVLEELSYKSELKVEKRQKVYFNKEVRRWQCSCKLANKIGLPCPHVIHMVRKFEDSLIYYIHSKWHLNQPKQREERIKLPEQKASQWIQEIFFE